MKLDLRKRWKKVRAAFGRAWHAATNPIHRAVSAIGRQRWLRLPAQLFRRVPAALRSVGGVLRRAGDGLRRVPELLRAVPFHLKAALLAVARLRPNARFWTIVLGLLTVPLGALLMVTPVRELATGRALDLRSLLTATWLLTGAATLTAGLGMLFRAPSFRVMVWLALLCSLPLPAAFGYRTWELMQKMQGADEPTVHTLQPWIDGGVQLTSMFLGLSVFLGTLPWLRPLRNLQCTTPLLRGRAGILLAPCYGGGIGMGVGYGLWLALRYIAERDGLEFLRRGLGVLRVEHFAYACGALGAAWLAWRWWHAPRTVARVPRVQAPQPAPAPRTAPPPAAAPPRPAAATPPRPTQPAPSQPLPIQPRRPQPAGTVPRP